MQRIRIVIREIFGLFVDDGSFAFAILAWTALVWWLRYQMNAAASGVILFAGLGIILIVSLIRFSRKSAKSLPDQTESRS